MIVLESKLKGKDTQYCAIDKAIRTALFIRNKTLRFWMDNQGVGKNDLMRYATCLRGAVEWCRKLNSMACQASVVRLIKRADGYYAQFCIDSERREKRALTGKETGIDVGLEYFYTDSGGNTIENPRYLRKSEKALKRLHHRVSKKFKRGQKPSKNYIKARKRLAKKHLKVSRQRKDFGCW